MIILTHVVPTNVCDTAAAGRCWICVAVDALCSARACHIDLICTTGGGALPCSHGDPLYTHNQPPHTHTHNRARNVIVITAFIVNLNLLCTFYLPVIITPSRSPVCVCVCSRPFIHSLHWVVDTVSDPSVCYRQER